MVSYTVQVLRDQWLATAGPYSSLWTAIKEALNESGRDPTHPYRVVDQSGGVVWTASQ